MNLSLLLTPGDIIFVAFVALCLVIGFVWLVRKAFNAITNFAENLFD